MKKLWRFVVVSMMLLALGATVSCGGNGSIDDEPEVELSPEEAKLVGYWLNHGSSARYPNLFLEENGVCYVIVEDLIKSGNWTYDETTKILATSVDSWQFNVTLLNDETWAASYVEGDKVFNQSFERASNYSSFEFLVHFIRPQCNMLLDVNFADNENKEDCVFDYTVDLGLNTKDLTGEVAISNIYNENKAELVFTGDIQMTTKLKNLLDAKATVERSSQREAVDLGLSVRWATNNLNSYYYAWGELKVLVVSSYGFDYEHLDCSASGKELNDIGGSIRDIARMEWGGTWRMPTKAEWDELIENCTWTWVPDGINSGYKVQSKKNGNSIFLQAKGYRSYFDGDLNLNGIVGWYRSSTPGTSEYFGDTYSLRFDDEDYEMQETTRRDGYSIRPVCD